MDHWPCYIIMAVSKAYAKVNVSVRSTDLNTRLDFTLAYWIALSLSYMSVRNMMCHTCEELSSFPLEYLSHLYLELIDV